MAHWLVIHFHFRMKTHFCIPLMLCSLQPHNEISFHVLVSVLGFISWFLKNVYIYIALVITESIALVITESTALVITESIALVITESIALVITESIALVITESIALVITESGNYRKYCTGNY